MCARVVARVCARTRTAKPRECLCPQGLGNVDGTTAMYGDEGYIFLFNPNLRIMNATLDVDESLGEHCARGLALLL